MEDFKADGEKRTANSNEIKLLFVQRIFEAYWRSAYLNYPSVSKSRMKYSVPIVYQNEKTTIEFSAVPLDVKEILSILRNTDLFNGLIALSKASGNVQVAYGSSTKPKPKSKDNDGDGNDMISCPLFWLKNKKLKKKYFLKSEALTLENCEVAI